MIIMRIMIIFLREGKEEDRIHITEDANSSFISHEESEESEMNDRDEEKDMEQRSGLVLEVERRGLVGGEDNREEKIEKEKRSRVLAFGEEKMTWF